MKLDQVPNRRPAALAGLRARRFVGYALKTPDGWVCVMSLGLSWSKSVHRTADEARMCLRSAASATDFDWFATVEQLESYLEKLGDDAPSITPEMLRTSLSHRQRLTIS